MYTNTMFAGIASKKHGIAGSVRVNREGIDMHKKYKNNRIPKNKLCWSSHNCITCRYSIDKNQSICDICIGSSCQYERIK